MKSRVMDDPSVLCGVTLEGKRPIRGQVKQHTTDDIASALARLRTTNNRRPTTDKVRLQAVGVVHSMLHGLAPTRLRALGAASPHSLLQLAKDRIVLVVAFDDGLRVGGLHCLLKKPDLARHASRRGQVS